MFRCCGALRLRRRVCRRGRARKPDGGAVPSRKKSGGGSSTFAKFLIFCRAVHGLTPSMLRKRLIGLLTVRNGIVVQSFRFGCYLPVGRPEISAEYLDRWGIDEILLVDIGASAAGRCISPAIVEGTARRCTVPLAVRGGFRSVAA